MWSKQGNLTHSLVRDVIFYDPETGFIFWRNHPRHKSKNGTRAGCVHKHKGYLYLRIGGAERVATPVIWLYMTGRWPEETVDHKDRDKLNNKWDNLREATYSQNGANRRSSGVLPRGVHRVRRKFRAQIHVQRKRIRLGVFSTAEEAGQAYRDAERLYFGDFAGSLRP